MRLVFALFGAVATVLLTVAMLFTAGWGHPPIVGTQIGFRGTGMDQVTTSAAVEQLEALNAMPDQIPKASPDGPRATEVYKNVQVLTDLSVDQFNTLMAAMTTWVAPQQGCAYCHNVENLADDSVYAKKVARRMIQMTRHINQDWKPHVQTTGVVCYTCHRGNPVPTNVWYENPGWPHAGGFAATNYGFGHPNAANGSTDLLQDPYTPYLEKDDNIRVQATERAADDRHGLVDPNNRRYVLPNDVDIEGARRQLHLLPQHPRIWAVVGEHAAACHRMARDPAGEKSQQRISRSAQGRVSRNAPRTARR